MKDLVEAKVKLQQELQEYTAILKTATVGSYEYRIAQERILKIKEELEGKTEELISVEKYEEEGIANLTTEYEKINNSIRSFSGNTDEAAEAQAELMEKMQLFSTTMGPLIDPLVTQWSQLLFGIEGASEKSFKEIKKEWEAMITAMIAKAAILASISFIFSGGTGGAAGWVKAFRSFFGGSAKKGGILMQKGGIFPEGLGKVRMFPAQHGIMTRETTIIKAGDTAGGEAFLPLDTFWKKLDTSLAKYATRRQPTEVIIKMDGLVSLRDKNVQDRIYRVATKPAAERWDARKFI